MERNNSLLNKIRSKYILKKILTFAYRDMNSVFKLTKYNKSLMNKLDINMKKFQDYYQYELRTDKKNFCSNFYYLIRDIIIFIFLMVFIIIYNKKGEFSLKSGYEEKENFVVIMNDYILYIYFIFILAFILVNILLIFRKIIVLKSYKKILSILFYFVIHLIHHLLFLCKLIYSEFKDPILNGLEIFLIIFFICSLLYSFIVCLPFYCCGECFHGDIMKFFLKQLKGINICEYELPPEYNNLNEKEKYALIFGGEKIKQYNYKLNDDQINLIDKINNIRNQYNLSPYKYSEFEKLPEFLINEKTELNFYPYQNIYKLNDGLYIFKYAKNELKKICNNNEILNIITNDLLKNIYIIEQNNFEFICFYINLYISKNINYPPRKNNNNFNLNKNRSRPAQIHNIGINLNIPDDSIVNTEDKLDNKSLILNMNT